MSASYSLCKILWIRDNQPDIYASTHRFMHAKDAIVARLTGHFATEPTDASGMNLYDLEAGTWSERIIEAAELDPAKLPELRQSIDVVGYVLSQVAPEWGCTRHAGRIGGGDGCARLLEREWCAKGRHITMSDLRRGSRWRPNSRF